MRTVLLEILAGLITVSLVRANPDAKRLYSNLLANYDRSHIPYNAEIVHTNDDVATFPG